MQSIKSLELSAPAKLNLFLHVVGRRADGYHLLESVFVMVDLCDTIKLTARPDGDIRRTGDVIGAPEKDLCIKAANLLKSHTGCSFGADIDVIKRIPAGAGMGGGSSDAATTLMGLNALWDLRLSREELMALGAKLGADVPFFLLGTNAWVEGIGEKLTPLDLPEMQFDIIWPGVSQATVEIFSHPLLTRDTKSVKILVFNGQRTAQDWMRLGHNDLETVVRLVSPEVNSLLEQRPQYRLTGSGSAVFRVIDSDSDRVSDKLPEKWQHFSVKSLKIHPTLSALSC